MKPLNQLLDEIEQRADKATSGPWGMDELESYDGDSVACWIIGNIQIETGDDWWISVEPDYKGDAQFIAHARTDVPRLVKALRRCMGAMVRYQDDILESDLEQIMRGEE